MPVCIHLLLASDAFTHKKAILPRLNLSNSKMANSVRNTQISEVPSGFEPLYEVLQTSA